MLWRAFWTLSSSEPTWHHCPSMRLLAVRSIGEWGFHLLISVSDTTVSVSARSLDWIRLYHLHFTGAGAIFGSLLSLFRSTLHSLLLKQKFHDKGPSERLREMGFNTTGGQEFMMLKVLCAVLEICTPSHFSPLSPLWCNLQNKTGTEPWTS